MVIHRRAGRNRAQSDGTPATAGRRVEGTKTAGESSCRGACLERARVRLEIGAASGDSTSTLRPRDRMREARAGARAGTGARARGRPSRRRCASPDDRKVDRREVDADLVRPAGLEPHVEQRVLGQHLDELEQRDRVARLVRVERPPRRVAAVAADRGVDPPRARARRPRTSARYRRSTSRVPDRLLERGERLAPCARRRAGPTCRGRAGARSPDGRDRRLRLRRG